MLNEHGEHSEHNVTHIKTHIEMTVDRDESILPADNRPHLPPAPRPFFSASRKVKKEEKVECNCCCIS